jgi:hypothetical protein
MARRFDQFRQHRQAGLAPTVLVRAHDRLRHPGPTRHLALRQTGAMSRIPDHLGDIHTHTGEYSHLSMATPRMKPPSSGVSRSNADAFTSSRRATAIDWPGDDN